MGKAGRQGTEQGFSDMGGGGSRCTHCTLCCSRFEGGQTHLTYLCVGGLAQCVVAIPDDR